MIISRKIIIEISSHNITSIIVILDKRLNSLCSLQIKHNSNVNSKNWEQDKKIPGCPQETVSVMEELVEREQERLSEDSSLSSSLD